MSDSFLNHDTKIILLFIIAKLAVYTFWCWFGIRLLAPSTKNRLAIAFGLACLRIVVGFALGFAWTYTVGSVAPSNAFSRLGFDPVPFFLGFLVLRFLQWSVISLIIRWTNGSLALVGSGADWLWRLGGVTLSFVADVAAVVVWVGIVGVIC